MTAKHTNQFLLPDVVDPPTRSCVKINVPDNFYHQTAFWSCLFELARWFNWQRDSLHTGKDVAAVWLEIYNEAKESACMDYILRQNPFDDCDLQISYDNGEVWETLYNARNCAVTAISDVLGPTSTNPGSHTQPGEQYEGGNPQPGQCFDLDLTVQANGAALIPLAITDGWTVKLTNVSGAWSDGDYPWVWQCPTGKGFLAGICTNIDGPTVATDPMPAVIHMKMIARLPSGTYVEIPIDGTEYTVPTGQPTGNMFLLPNDSNLSDNQGSVSLHVKACSPVPVVVHCTYLLQATGPAIIGIGDTFDIEVNVPDGGLWNGGVRFDRCCTLTYIATIDGPVTQADYEDCNGTVHSGFGTTNVTKMGFNSSVQRFTLRLRLDSVS